MIVESDYKLEKSLKRYPVKAIIVRLRRGAITTDVARQELLKIIPKPELVEAILEAEAKIYTISIDRLISMREYIPISIEMLKQKAEAIGMPPDEARLIIGYAFAREIKTELDALWRAYKRQFIDGFMTQDELTEKLDQLATLWGRASEITGLDWILYSPEERKVMIMSAVEERKLKEARMVLSGKELVGMMEYVPVRPELLQERLAKDVLPEQERKLVKALAFAREMAKEVDAYWREIRMWYLKDLMTLEDLKSELEWLVTLGGKVREWFGLDWLWYSPHQRDMMIMEAEHEYARRKALAITS